MPTTSILIITIKAVIRLMEVLYCRVIGEVYMNTSMIQVIQTQVHGKCLAIKTCRHGGQHDMVRHHIQVIT